MKIFWKWLRRLGWIVGILVVSILLFYGVENFRGKRAWDGMLADLEATGESTDLDDFEPKSVPDAENWGANPLLKELAEIQDDGELTGTWAAFDERQNTIFWEGENAYKYIYDQPETLEEQYAEWRGIEYFKNWQSHFFDRENPLIDSIGPDPLKDILKVLAPLEAELRQLEVGLDLPYAVFSPPMSDFSSIESAMDLSHAPLSAMQGIARTAAFRSHVLLASGDSDAAFPPLLVALRLAELTDSGPFFIDFLVADTFYRICQKPIWMALEKRSFTAAQLKRLQDQLSKREFMTSLLSKLRADRALVIRGVETTFVPSEKREAVVEASLGGLREIFPDLEVETKQRILLYLLPRGWIYQNFARMITLQSNFNVEPVASGEIAFLTKRFEEYDALRSSLKPSPYTLFGTGGTLPGRVFVQYFKTQVAIDQMIIACALERHFIDKGTYPDSLEALVPAYLDTEPMDRMASAPMRYVLTDDGRYRIYSVGWNQKDDGGVEFFGKVKTLEEEVDDWVWQYSPAAKPR